MEGFDPKTGERKWSGNLSVSDAVWSSPTGADGKIYCISENGTVIVCEAGEEFKILAKNKMGEGSIYSSVAISNGQIFLRTAQNLYCIGKK